MKHEQDFAPALAWRKPLVNRGVTVIAYSKLDSFYSEFTALSPHCWKVYNYRWNAGVEGAEKGSHRQGSHGPHNSERPGLLPSVLTSHSYNHSPRLSPQPSHPVEGGESPVPMRFSP